MRKNLAFVFFLSLFLISFVSYAIAVEGSGNIVSERRNIEDFQQIELQLTGKLQIYQGDHEYIEIETDDNILTRIKTDVENNVLRIHKSWFTSFNPSRPIIYRVYLKNLSSIKASGASTVWSESLKFQNLNLKLSGSTEMEIENLTGNSLDVDISGSGEITMKKGEVEEFNMKISGSGDWKSEKLKINRSDVKISGSGSARLWVVKKLNIKISGSGSINYYGEPEITKNISGSGEVNSLGFKE